MSETDTSSGTARYAFVCYAHENSDEVHEYLRLMDEHGLRYWYDRGISPGTRWSDELANALGGSRVVLFFCTHAAAKSRHCRDEISYALEEKIPIIVIRQGDVELPSGLRLQLGSQQALIKDDLSSDELYRRLIESLAKYLDKEPEAPAATGRRATGGIQRRVIRSLTVGGIALVIAVAGFVFWQQPVPPSEKGSEMAIGLPTIAVMPFRVINDDATVESVARGLETEIPVTMIGSELDALRKRDIQTRQGFMIISSAEISPQLTTPNDVLEASRTEYVISGSIQRDDQNVRATVQLTFFGERRAVWSHVYTYSLDDLLALQSDVALHAATSIIQEVALHRFAWQMKETMPAAAWPHWRAARRLGHQRSVGEYVDPREFLNTWLAYHEHQNNWLQVAAPYHDVYSARIQRHEDVTDFAELSHQLDAQIAGMPPEWGPWWAEYATVLKANNALVLMNLSEQERLLNELPGDFVLRNWTVLIRALLEGNLVAQRDATHAMYTDWDASPMPYLNALMSLGQTGLGIESIDEALLTQTGGHSRARILGMKANACHEWEVGRGT